MYERALCAFIFYFFLFFDLISFHFSIHIKDLGFIRRSCVPAADGWVCLIIAVMCCLCIAAAATAVRFNWMPYAIVLCAICCLEHYKNVMQSQIVLNLHIIIMVFCFSSGFRCFSLSRPLSSFFPLALWFRCYRIQHNLSFSQMNDISEIAVHLQSVKRSRAGNADV